MRNGGHFENQTEGIQQGDGREGQGMHQGTPGTAMEKEQTKSGTSTTVEDTPDRDQVRSQVLQPTHPVQAKTAGDGLAGNLKISHSHDQCLRSHEEAWMSAGKADLPQHHGSIQSGCEHNGKRSGHGRQC